LRLVLQGRRRRSELRRAGVTTAGTSFQVQPKGPFSLREAASFGFGPAAGEGGDTMRLAFVVDGFTDHAAVELRQTEKGIVRANVHGNADLRAVKRQVRRILSLDYSGTEFEQVGERDPVIGRLQARFPGLRPVLFNSPYEAAAWSVLSQRRGRRQAMAARQRLCAELGKTFDLDGETLEAFPLPEDLLDLDSFPGLEPRRLERLRDVARAALTGMLDPTRLRAIGWEQALEEVQLLHGIGPTYGGLIVHRSVGFADSLATGEQRGLEYVAKLYRLKGPPDEAKFAKLAERWRPFRTWAMVLIRSAGDRGALQGTRRAISTSST
jgi:DNA-3-methyladenine glycosylase II